jgi:D-3-phosphoglycerate dehydrogenase
MRKVLITASFYERDCAKACELLEQHDCHIMLVKGGGVFTMDEIIQRIPDVDGVIAGSEKWGEEIFKLAPKLKIVSRFGVGYDMVDIAKAKEYGIVATNVRNFFLANGVAEFAVGLMLDVLKGIDMLGSKTRQGIWDRNYVGSQLYGKTVGIVGFGAIGRQVAKILSGFSIKLLAYDVYPNVEEAKKLNVEFATKDEILKTCDIITLHIPSSAENYHFIGRNEFEIMKDSAVLINTARGIIVDTEALIEALSKRKIAGAGLDVFESEPLESDSLLHGFDNVVLTPHCANQNRESLEAVGLDCAQAVLDVFDGKTPKDILNP